MGKHNASPGPCPRGHCPRGHCPCGQACGKAGGKTQGAHPQADGKRRAAAGRRQGEAGRQVEAEGPQPEPEPEQEDVFKEVDPAEAVKIRQKTLEDLQTAYANGHQKEVLELLSRFGNGAKSFRELPVDAFVPIREAIDNGALA